MHHDVSFRRGESLQSDRQQLSRLRRKLALQSRDTWTRSRRTPRQWRFRGWRHRCSRFVPGLLPRQNAPAVLPSPSSPAIAPTRDFQPYALVLRKACISRRQRLRRALRLKDCLWLFCSHELLASNSDYTAGQATSLASFRPSCRCSVSDTHPKTPPCIFTELMAASWFPTSVAPTLSFRSRHQYPMSLASRIMV